MTHAASRRACHPLRPVHHDLEAGRDLRPGRPAAHTGRLRDAGLRVLPGMIMLAGRLVDPPAARKRSARSTRPSGRTHSPPGRLVRDRPVHRRGSTAAPTAACSSAPRGPSGSARTPRSSPPSRAPVRSSRPARDRHWPPPSTRADRRPVYPRTLRQHREARIMSGHSRSATAHPGYSPTGSPGSGKQQPRRVTIGGSSAQYSARDVDPALRSSGMRTFICGPGRATAFLDD
jgi:hypothetical protein